MKISLLSKQTRGNTVSATIRLHHGTLDRLTGLDVPAMSIVKAGDFKKAAAAQ